MNVFQALWLRATATARALMVCRGWARGGDVRAKRLALARHAAGRRPRLRYAFGAPLAALSAAAFLVSMAPNAGARTSPSATPSPSPSRTELPSSVSLSETPDGTGHENDAYLLKAGLSPAGAYGRVTLTDNGRQIASAVDYEVQWTFSASSMSVGDHHLTVVFTPVAASGYTPSRASIDYLIEVSSPSPTPTPTHASPTPSRTPTRSATPTPSATRTATPVPTGTVNSGSPSSGKTSLPFTGFNAEQLLLDSAVLIAGGAALLLVAQVRRRVSKAPSPHAT